MQDDTQRHDAAAVPPHGAPQQPPPAPAPTPAPAPAPESTVTPRGLEGLRAADPTPQPRPFDPLGLGHTREPLPFHTDLDSPLPFGDYHDPEPHEPMYLPLALSVGAGFKFGCGFMLAVAVSVFGLFLVGSVIFFVAALAGLPVPGAAP